MHVQKLRMFVLLDDFSVARDMDMLTVETLCIRSRGVDQNISVPAAISQLLSIAKRGLGFPQSPGIGPESEVSR